jgi:hypothetical protein
MEGRASRTSVGGFYERRVRRWQSFFRRPAVQDDPNGRSLEFVRPRTDHGLHHPPAIEDGVRTCVKQSNSKTRDIAENLIEVEHLETERLPK